MSESTEKKAEAVGFLKKLFCFSGRATVKQFWLTVLKLTVAQVVICILFGLGTMMGAVGLVILGIPAAVLMIALFVAALANLFRRLHDLGLSGYWTCYLIPSLGLSAIYFAYIMDADKSASEMVDRIKAMGNIWGWILAFVLWPAGCIFGLLLISFAPGQEKDNRYGPSPYVTANSVPDAVA